MKAIGIICEYNPFHNGHLHHLNEIKKLYPNHLIILVMSGYFTQRGDVSIINKYDKTNMALEMGIDLVIELPFIFATQSADMFASGAIQILNELKVEAIVFGSEYDDIEVLKKLVNIQLTDEYDSLVRSYLKEGINYPTAMSKVLKELSNINIQQPNDLLAISYIKAIKMTSSNIIPISIKRTNDYHSLKTDNSIISASAIRNLIKENKDYHKYIPSKLSNYNISYIDLNNYFDLIKYKILSEGLSIKNYQTVDEGIEYKIINVINECQNIDDLIIKIKSKRYTYNKIKRMLLHILCSFKKEENNNKIQYIRLLGTNQNGRQYLKEIKKDINIPIISKLAGHSFSELELEKRVTNIYNLRSKLIINEYKEFPIIK